MKIYETYITATDEVETITGIFLMSDTSDRNGSTLLFFCAVK